MRNKIFNKIISCFMAAVCLTAFSSCRALIKRDSDRAWEYLTDRYRDDVFEFSRREDGYLWFSSKKIPGKDIKVDMMMNRPEEDNYLHLLYADQTAAVVDKFLQSLLGDTDRYVKDVSREFYPVSGDEVPGFDEYISYSRNRLKYNVYLPMILQTEADLLNFQNSYYSLLDQYNINEKMFEFRFVDSRAIKDLRSGLVSENDAKIYISYEFKVRNLNGLLDNGWNFRTGLYDPRI